MDDWNIVTNECSPLAPHWEQLSRLLGLPYSTIIQIKQEHINDVTSCWSEALSQWIRQNYNTERYFKPSWRTLLGAIAKVNRLLFQNLVKKYQGRQNSHAICISPICILCSCYHLLSLLSFGYGYIISHIIHCHPESHNEENSKIMTLLVYIGILECLVAYSILRNRYCVVFIISCVPLSLDLMLGLLGFSEVIKDASHIILVLNFVIMLSYYDSCHLTCCQLYRSWNFVYTDSLVIVFCIALFFYVFSI